MAGQIGQSEKKRAIVESIAAGASRAAACRAAHVARSTFYEWLRDDEVFRVVVERRELELIQTVESEALACALKASEDPRYQTSLIFWLKANAGWKETTVVQHGLDDGAGDTRESILGRIRELASRFGEGQGALGAGDGDAQ